MPMAESALRVPPYDCALRPLLSRRIVHLISIMGTRGLAESAGARHALRVIACLEV
jgi:hypothetical protein